MADLLAVPSFDRLRECQGERCGWLFIDSSKSGRRRWCTMEDCGNRAKARRYYQRHKPAG
jgi:predicted RNA-binding Zn ribbon-like protein